MNPTAPVRLGVHGSPDLARRIVTAAGHRVDEVEFVPYEVTDPFRPLRDGAQDLMIVKYELEEPDLVCSGPVAHDARALVVHKDHPLAGRASVSVEEVADYEAFQRPGDFPANVWDRVVPRFTPGGRPIRRVHPLTTIDALAARLAESPRAVHLSVQSLDASVPAWIRVVPVTDLPPAPVALAWLLAKPLPPAAAALVADAERSFAR
jgi:hypothetical protein